MNHARVLLALAAVLALSSQQPAVAQPFGRAAVVKGKSLCLVERTAANCLKPGLGDVRLPLWSKDGEKVAFIESTPATQALALAWVFPLATDDVLIDHLADDPAPRVRAAVARAAWTRRSILGDTGVVRRLLGDADPEVRAAAWKAVKS